MGTRDIPLRRMDPDFPIYVNHFRKGEGTAVLSGLPFHIDDNFIIVVNVEGFGSMDVDFRTVGGAMPLLTYVNPGDVHGNIVVEDSDFWCVKISPDVVPPQYVEKMMSFPAITSPVLMSGDLYASILKVLSLMEDFVKYEIPAYHEYWRNVLSLFFSLVVHAISEYPTAYADSDTLPDKKLIRDFSKLIEEYYLKRKQIKFYADRLNVSSSYLSELCKRYTGKSMQQLLLDRIILEAQRLLRYSELTVKEIAIKLGYDDSSYFSRLYKVKTGESPMAYRSKEK